jgi:long-subunit acyl-CoA synthetase (AMP-forming)
MSFLLAVLYLCSGDIGLVDRAGYLYVTGRMRDLVITAGGDNILPVPLEQKILVCTCSYCCIAMTLDLG